MSDFAELNERLRDEARGKMRNVYVKSGEPVPHEVRGRSRHVGTINFMITEDAERRVWARIVTENGKENRRLLGWGTESLADMMWSNIIKQMEGDDGCDV